MADLFGSGRPWCGACVSVVPGVQGLAFTALAETGPEGLAQCVVNGDFAG